MSFLANEWITFRDNLLSVLNSFKFTDVIDILVVAYLLYQAIRLVRETRAMQLTKGIAAVFGVYFAAQILSLNTMKFILQNVLTWGVIVVAVVFQPELRSALEQAGRSKFSPLGRGGDRSEEDLLLIQELVDSVSSAAAYLSERRTGALMVIEREIKLGEIIKTGTTIDARSSLEMIANIFFPNSPMHDGAVIIRDCRLLAAGCFLPLSNNMTIGRELGTRHRAALGMSEVSDAVVVVVSEETGAITVAVDSRLQRGLSEKNLHKLLEAKLLGPRVVKPDSKKVPFWRKKT